jgi:hypothetical protein
MLIKSNEKIHQQHMRNVVGGCLSGGVIYKHHNVSTDISLVKQSDQQGLEMVIKF